MRYKTSYELPVVLHEELPEGAKAIYIEVFWSVWEQEIDPDWRQDEKFKQELAHRFAWAAVKKAYLKNEHGQWVRETA